jgi:hypothetical protein
MGLQLRNKTPKRRVKAKLRDDRKVATRPNETWAMDFVHDQLATGRKIRVLTVVDIFSRYPPAIDPRLSYRGEDVVQVLEKVCGEVRDRLPDHDPRRPRHRVCLPRSRPVALHQRRDARLQPAGQADRQRVQPAIMTKPGNSNTGWSKVRGRSNDERIPPAAG